MPPTLILKFVFNSTSTLHGLEPTSQRRERGSQSQPQVKGFYSFLVVWDLNLCCMLHTPYDLLLGKRHDKILVPSNFFLKSNYKILTSLLSHVILFLSGSFEFRFVNSQIRSTAQFTWGFSKEFLTTIFIIVIKVNEP